MRSAGLLAAVATLATFSSIARGQEVVSAQSGVINYSEGAVLVDDTPLDRKPATFPLLKDGSVLRTEKGRAELLLTPGTFLRLDENSSVKMQSSSLTATSLEFLKGSAILDCTAAQGAIPVTLQYKDASVTFSKPGLYRVDSDTEVLQAYSGEAVVKQQGKQTQIDPTRLYFFELDTDTKKFDDGTDDEFLDWARNRNDVITAENQATQAEDQDADADPNLGTAPFNFNAPYGLNAPFGSLNAVPSMPNLSPIYPYNSYFSYVPTVLWALPPLPGPAFIIGRPFAYRPVSPSWPHSSTWQTSHGLTSTGLRLTTPRPLSVYSHPVYSHPAVAPRPVAPAVHPIGHR